VACAQETIFQTWTSAGIEKKLSKKLSLLLSEELRFGFDKPHQYSFLSEAGTKYKLGKKMDASINLRVTVRGNEITYRPYVDLSYEVDIQKFTIEPRLRYQYQLQKNEPSESYFRAKSTVKYAINKRWQPYVSGELFYHAFYYKGSLFDEYRLAAGIEHTYKKVHTIKIFYLFDQEFNVNNPTQRHAAGLAYEYEF
jgi:hypothetical protein